MSRAKWLTMSGALLLISAPDARAETAVPMSGITSMWNAWYQDSLAIRTSATEASAGCPTTGVYVTDPQNPASKLIQPMIISAYMARRKVALTLDGCLMNSYPIIISVSVEP